MLQYNLLAQNGIQRLALAFGITTAALTFNFITQEQAFAGSFGYAYQQVDALRITGGFTGYTFTSSTSGNASINGSGSSLSNAYDTGEASIGTGGLGNNSGFFSNPGYNLFDNPLPTEGTGTGFDATPSSSKGLVNGNYGRGDAVISNGTNSITTDADVNSLIKGTGLYLANVGESYVVNGLSTVAPGILQTQGSATGEYSFTSTNFTLGSSDSNFIDFAFNYRNELYTELTTSTFPGAPTLNQATSSVAFTITLNKVNGATVTAVQRIRPSLLQQNFAQTDISGVSTTPINSAFGPDPITGSFTDLELGTTYRIVIAASAIVDTRLSEGVPEPFTILGTGTALGFGALFKGKMNQKSKKSSQK